MQKGEEVKSFNNSCLKQKVKSLVDVSKKKNLIKPHTEAFRTYPTSKECHKGNISYFVSKE